MNKVNENVLPHVLIIDDQFGRCDLGYEFKNSIDSRIYSAFQADRKNLCNNYGLLDASEKQLANSGNRTALATFSSGQRWNNSKKCIENDLELVIEDVQNGWPFDDGSRWALVLLDLAFVCGELDTFGDPQERSMFGSDVILPGLKKEFGDDLPIVVLSSTPKDENNPSIRKAGALDFIQRIPGAGAPPDEAQKRLSDALFFHGLVEDDLGIVFGNSLATLKMLRQARRAAIAGKTVLLIGEIGAGKNNLAKYIHRISNRNDQPFEIYNASHRSAQLQEDELFGHWKGAFTGAINDAPGIWERCNGGVVFIDEVADLEKSIQQKLMEPIETQKVKRMGHSRSSIGQIDINVLTILATNRDPGILKQDGVLKQDFLNRINANVIIIPPLRERKEDIPLLIEILSKSVDPNWPGHFYQEAINKLMAHSWTEGNVRELRNVIQSALLNHPGQDITMDDIQFTEMQDEVKNIEITAPEDKLLWQEFLSVLMEAPDELTRRECEIYRNKYHGVFTDLMAHILSWSLQLNDDASNTARFLSGSTEKEMDSSAAQQFLKKFLKMDTKGRRILKKFLTYPESDNPVMKKIIEKNS